MGITDALPPHALPEPVIEELREQDHFEDVHPSLVVVKPEESFDLVAGFQVMRGDDSIGFGFRLDEEEWEIVEQASYADAGSKDAAGKIVADAMEEWSPAPTDTMPDLYAGFSDGDQHGDVQAHEDIELSDAMFAQYRDATGD